MSCVYVDRLQLFLDCIGENWRPDKRSFYSQALDNQILKPKNVKTIQDQAGCLISCKLKRLETCWS